MAQLGCWLIGEFGEMLVNGSGVDETGQSVKITPDEIIDTYVDVLDENDRKGDRSDTIISWALTALSKLSVRLTGMHEKVKELIEGYSDHANVEIQQRAFEYGQIFEASWQNERNQLFEAIPFKGDEGMLVSQSDRVATNADDDKLVINSKPRVVEAAPTNTFNLDDLIGGSSTSQTSV